MLALGSANTAAQARARSADHAGSEPLIVGVPDALLVRGRLVQGADDGAEDLHRQVLSGGGVDTAPVPPLEGGALDVLKALGSTPSGQRPARDPGWLDFTAPVLTLHAAVFQRAGEVPADGIAELRESACVAQLDARGLVSLAGSPRASAERARRARGGAARGGRLRAATGLRPLRDRAGGT